MTITIPPEFETLHLASGSHDSREEGMCAMEAVSWLAGKDHTDNPPCVPDTLGNFLRNWNDNLPNDRRDLLKPYLPRVIGLAKDAATEAKRSWLAMDWLTRECAPAWLDLAGLNIHASAMRSLPEIVDASSYVASLDVSAAARNRLLPTTEALIISAQGLLERMIAA